MEGSSSVSDDPATPLMGGNGEGRASIAMTAGGNTAASGGGGDAAAGASSYASSTLDRSTSSIIYSGVATAWDRSDFLSAVTNVNRALTQALEALCEEVLSDVGDDAPALVARALHDAFRVAEERGASGAAAAGSPEAAMALVLDKTAWALPASEIAASACESLRQATHHLAPSLPGLDALVSRFKAGPGGLSLSEAVEYHLRIHAYAAAMSPALLWRVSPSSTPICVPYDAETQQAISFSGNSPRAGDSVYAIGPQLLASTTSTPRMSAQEVVDLRGHGRRMLVIL